MNERGVARTVEQMHNSAIAIVCVACKGPLYAGDTAHHTGDGWRCSPCARLAVGEPAVVQQEDERVGGTRTSGKGEDAHASLIGPAHASAPESSVPAPDRELGELLDDYKMRIQENRPSGNVKRMQAEAAARRAIEEYVARREYEYDDFHDALEAIAELNATVSQLREQLHEQEQVDEGVREYHQRLKAENASLREQLEAARKESK